MDKTKEIEEKKAKEELEEKRKKFIKDIEVVQDKHNMKIQAILNFNVNGITPALIILPKEEKRDEAVPSIR